MAIVKPFKGVRPPKNLVEQVESRPYDVLNSEEARAEAGDNEKSLYQISNQVLLSTILAFMKALQRTSESSRRMAG
jgi:uncharacterized protein (DUF1015 family)